MMNLNPDPTETAHALRRELGLCAEQPLSEMALELLGHFGGFRLFLSEAPSYALGHVLTVNADSSPEERAKDILAFVGAATYFPALTLPQDRVAAGNLLAEAGRRGEWGSAFADGFCGKLD